MTKTKLVFAPNATTTAMIVGRTPFILGCDTNEVTVAAGTRVQILETYHAWTRTKTPVGWVGFNDPRKPYYKVRIAGSKPDCYWVLWLGSEPYPVPDLIKKD